MAELLLDSDEVTSPRGRHFKVEMFVTRDDEGEYCWMVRRTGNEHYNSKSFYSTSADARAEFNWHRAQFEEVRAQNQGLSVNPDGQVTMSHPSSIMPGRATETSYK